MDYLSEFEQWRDHAFFDTETRAELLAFNIEDAEDIKEIEDRFYKECEFGTGGMRGIMGAGTNRINKYVIGKVTTGLADYLLESFGEKSCRAKGVVICYDTRLKSKEFAETTADVLSAKGVKAYLFNNPRPTPQLSFAVRILNCLAGVVITASHNPKEYNGYKIYDQYGCQMVPVQVEKIIPYINRITRYQDIEFQSCKALVHIIDETDSFIEAVLQQSRVHDESIKKDFKIVYTPLHGTGYVPISEVLKQDGFFQVKVVESQISTVGTFATVKSPNPEDKDALTRGILIAEEYDADIVIGTDPDCDRMGLAIKTDGRYELLTGNQIGALLIDFLLNYTELIDYEKPAIIKTIVTSELGTEIAKKRGVTVFSTLTGFKYIGEKITQFEKAKIAGCNAQAFDYIFGYEESYGYLVGSHARDKDAVVSSMLVCEMAAAYKAKGRTLLDRMNELYDEFGYYYDFLDSFTLEGKDGIARIDSIMNELRVSGKDVMENCINLIDYMTGVEAEPGFGKLPPSNVLKYIIADGSWVAVRPSGTEAKIKIYYNIKGRDEKEAKDKFFLIQEALEKCLNI